MAYIKSNLLVFPRGVFSLDGVTSFEVTPDQELALYFGSYDNKKVLNFKVEPELVEALTKYVLETEQKNRVISLMKVTKQLTEVPESMRNRPEFQSLAKMLEKELEKECGQQCQ